MQNKKGIKDGLLAKKCLFTIARPSMLFSTCLAKIIISLEFEGKFNFNFNHPFITTSHLLSKHFVGPITPLHYNLIMISPKQAHKWRWSWWINMWQLKGRKTTYAIVVNTKVHKEPEHVGKPQCLAVKKLS